MARTASGKAVLLAVAVSLTGCEALDAAQRERLQADVAQMRENGPPKPYRELVREAIRQRLSRPGTFAEGRMGAPRPGSTTQVLTRNGLPVSAPRTTAIGWIVCARYRAATLIGLETVWNTAIFFDTQGDVSRLDDQFGQENCARYPESLMEPFSLQPPQPAGPGPSAS